MIGCVSVYEQGVHRTSSKISASILSRVGEGQAL
jgi:hypothetical protein